MFNAWFPEYSVAVLLFLFYRVLFSLQGWSSSLPVDAQESGFGEVPSAPCTDFVSSEYPFSWSVSGSVFHITGWGFSGYVHIEG